MIEKFNKKKKTKKALRCGACEKTIIVTDAEHPLYHYHPLCRNIGGSDGYIELLPVSEKE